MRRILVLVRKEFLELRQMPVLLLRHRRTGQRIWFANFHNPASLPWLGSQRRHRQEARHQPGAGRGGAHRDRAGQADGPAGGIRRGLRVPLLGACRLHHWAESFARRRRVSRDVLGTVPRPLIPAQAGIQRLGPRLRGDERNEVLSLPCPCPSRDASSRPTSISTPRSTTP